MPCSGRNAFFRMPGESAGRTVRRVDIDSGYRLLQSACHRMDVTMMPYNRATSLLAFGWAAAVCGLAAAQSPAPAPVVRRDVPYATPTIDMETIFRDVAKSLGWVHRHIGEHGGDPARILVMGHCPPRATACPKTGSDLGKWLSETTVFLGLRHDSRILPGGSEFPRPARRHAIFRGPPLGAGSFVLAFDMGFAVRVDVHMERHWMAANGAVLDVVLVCSG